MAKIMTLLALLWAASPAFAARADSWFFAPNAGIGSNSAQETYFRVGLDLGMYIDENLYAGVGGFYSAGSRPEHDREYGAGPFVGYVYPVVELLSLHAREDIDYVDQRTPVLNSGNPDFYTHTQDYGVESSTYAGVQLSFTRNFGLSLGYRLVLGLSKASLGDGRSGAVVGFLIGI